MANVLHQEAIRWRLPGRRVWIASAFVLLWVVLYLALLGMNLWLRFSHGIISSELVWWEAQRRLVMEVIDPQLSLLIETHAPLVLYLTILLGSSLGATIVLGASALTLLSYQLRRAGTPLFWLPMVLLQPALLIAANQFPTPLMRGLLLAVALWFYWRYIQNQENFALMIFGLVLGLLILIDRGSIPVIGYLVLVFLIYPQRRWQRQLSTIVIAIFPACFLLLAWSYLNWSQRISFFDEQQLWLSSRQLFDSQSTFAPQPLDAVAAVTGILLLFVLCCALWQLGRRQAPFRMWLAHSLVLLAPLADAIWQWRSGQYTPLLACVFPLLALPLWLSILRQAPISAGIVGGMLLLSLALSWGMVMQPAANEPAFILRQLLGSRETAPLEPFQQIATTINHELQPGQRLMLDPQDVMPLVALIDQPQALLLPTQNLYSLARQHPAEWTSMVVLKQDDTQIPGQPPLYARQFLTAFQRIEQRGNLLLYQYQP